MGQEVPIDRHPIPHSYMGFLHPALYPPFQGQVSVIYIILVNYCVLFEFIGRRISLSHFTPKRVCLGVLWGPLSRDSLFLPQV